MSFVDFIQLPAQNVGDGVSDKVTCHILADTFKDS
jgi:hypothetical protein